MEHKMLIVKCPTCGETFMNAHSAEGEVICQRCKNKWSISINVELGKFAIRLLKNVRCNS